LLEKIQKGTQSERDAAYDRIFAAFREPVYALCLRLTGNTVDAEDALQESFMAAFRGLGMFRGEARISTWLYRIAVREALRHKKRYGANEARIMDEPAALEMTNPAIRRERLEQLNRGLDRLSAEHRTVLAMFALQGLTHDEIAAILKIPTGTVWSRLHKARKKLAEEIAALENQPFGPAAASGSRRAAKRSSATTSVLGLLLRCTCAVWTWVVGRRAVALGPRTLCKNPL